MTHTLIALLRGINVGSKQVSMPVLKSLFEQLGHSNVRTYIQSGNVVFEAETGDTATVASELGKAIQEHFGFEVKVLIRTAGEMKTVLDGNPLAGRAEGDRKKLHVTFLDREPESDRLDKIHPDGFLPDAFAVRGREIYLVCPDGYGRTRLSNSFFESRLKQTATTRNWNTVHELVRMSTPSD
ncbi:DUF1697 domain-containing protein [Larkinella soli]|uniref:DUF1697 domain-containing protein n=1 Tax=Larkinella soli TaxID=1770527 RepID=UPI000FFC6862|nr:DUF1697 domain-containing protein [Larkinella soli]